MHKVVVRIPAAHISFLYFFANFSNILPNVVILVLSQTFLDKTSKCNTTIVYTFGCYILANKILRVQQGDERQEGGSFGP